ncbi:MAG: S8 family serine peptidase [Planctomycetota bacterium]
MKQRWALMLGVLGWATIAAAGVVDEDLERVLAESAPDQTVSTLVFLQNAVNISALDEFLEASRTPLRERHELVVRELQAAAERSQGPLLEELAALQAAGLVAKYEAFWIANVIRVDAPASVVHELAERGDVHSVYVNYETELVAPVAEGPAGGSPEAPEQGLVAIRAPEAWAIGVTGAGQLVSTLDTGVDGAHPALASRWRGLDPRYAGHPQWAWFDPVTNTTFPQAFASHGTHTMGTVCGGAPGNEVGVAPGAQWIHAATIDRISIARTVSDSILAFQWVIDPDGNPGTNWDVPAVCSNSWGLRTSHGYAPCSTTFWSYLDACEAAGMVIVFAAGNEGTSEMRRPADRATDDFRTLAVAAVNANVAGWPIASFSSRGPTYCTPGGTAAIKPEIAAPGVQVRSSLPGGGYGPLDGTSMATPHIGGVVALMREACPELSVQEIKEIMFATAYDLGTVGNDNSYGWGMVDAYAAVQAAQAACAPAHGDLNCDGAVNFDDINPFVLLLSDPGLWQTTYPNCNPLNGDCNGDGIVDFDDINPFVALLSGA